MEFWPIIICIRVPLYRYYNSSKADHMLTSGLNELGYRRHGYKDEGIIGYVPN